MSGGPPRPNTGKNQDFNQRDVPTQFDKPTQAQDPFQEGNPPYIDPNQTDHGQSINRRQGPGTGTGLTEGAIKAAAGVPYDQTEPPDPVPLDLPIRRSRPSRPTRRSGASRHRPRANRGAPNRSDTIASRFGHGHVAMTNPPRGASDADADTVHHG
jgi:hypothetical protein